MNDNRMFGIFDDVFVAGCETGVEDVGVDLNEFAICEEVMFVG